jgi:hypothetical protein
MDLGAEHLVACGALALSLVADCRCEVNSESYLDPTGATNAAFVWFGAAGTVTPLHHDIVRTG